MYTKEYIQKIGGPQAMKAAFEGMCVKVTELEVRIAELEAQVAELTTPKLKQARKAS